MGRGHIFSPTLSEKYGEPERCDHNNESSHILMNGSLLEQKILTFFQTYANYVTMIATFCVLFFVKSINIFI